MLQPVMLVMDVRDGTDTTELAETIEHTINGYGLLYKWHVRYAIPMAYTLDVPKGAVTG